VCAVGSFGVVQLTSKSRLPIIAIDPILFFSIFPEFLFLLLKCVPAGASDQLDFLSDIISAHDIPRCVAVQGDEHEPCVTVFRFQIRWLWKPTDLILDN